MERIAEFERVSFEQFKKDWLDTFPDKYDDLDEEAINKTIHDIYTTIKLPKRATSGSAGYDFYCPSNLSIPLNGSIKIPTGIKCYMKDGWVLQCYPRSSYGFKYGTRLANTVGIVDKDYYNNEKNEGHIFIKLVNDNILTVNNVNIGSGDAFCQGIFTPFGITYSDSVTEVRVGGIGSTNKK